MFIHMKLGSGPHTNSIKEATVVIMEFVQYLLCKKAKAMARLAINKI